MAHVKGWAVWPGPPAGARQCLPHPGTSHQVCGTARAQDGDEFHLIRPMNLLARRIQILALGQPQEASEGEQGGDGQPPSTYQVRIFFSCYP